MNILAFIQTASPSLKHLRCCRTVYMIGSRRYVSRYPAPDPMHSWARFALELPPARSLMNEATRAASTSNGSTSELDQEGAMQLKIFVTLLQNVVKRHRQIHLARILSWENRIIENKRLSEFYDNFRCASAFSHQ